MKFIPQSISDIILIDPLIHHDERGHFFETFRKDLLEEYLGYKINFVQDNESKSVKGVLRGLHYQLPPNPQTKLVRVNYGNILDVAVDIRRSSPHFGQHVAVMLNDENKHQLLNYFYRTFYTLFLFFVQKILNLSYKNYNLP